MQLVSLTHKINNNFSTIFSKTLENDKKLKLDYSEYLVLNCIRQFPDGAHQRSIAEYVGVTESAISQHLNRLLNGKLIFVGQDLDDKRKNIVLLSKKGDRWLSKAEKVLKSNYKKLLKDLTSDEVKIATLLLKKLSKVLD